MTNDRDLETFISSGIFNHNLGVEKLQGLLLYRYVYVFKKSVL